MQGFRLSPQQRRLWTLHQAGGLTTACCRVKFQGAIDSDRLKAAIEAVAQRFEILRTTFPLLEGAKLPVQSIADSAAVGWDSEPPRDPSSLPVFKVQMGAESFAFSLPTLCADAPTMINVVREIARSYRGEKAAEDAFQYADLAEWQNELIESKDSEGEQARAHWSRVDVSWSTPLAMDTPPPPHNVRAFESLRTDSVRVTLDIEPVRQAAQNESRSIDAVLLAAWQALLARHTGQEEILIGAIREGRHLPDLADSVGPLSRSLPVRAATDPATAFRMLAAQADSALSEAARHQDYFDPENAARPLAEGIYPYGFECIDLSQPIDAGEAKFAIDWLDCPYELYRIELSCNVRPDNIDLAIRYDAARFQQSDVESLLAQYQTLLAGAVADTAATIGRLPTLPESERNKSLVEWNSTAADYPRDKTIHQLFEEQSARTPDSVAVVSEGQLLTYAELNRRANQLASRLKAEGIGPDRPVGLKLERGIGTVVGILGALKAGGAYVPLDLKLPADRIDYMLADSAATAVLTDTAAEGSIGRDDPSLESESAQNPESPVGPNNLAYIIYTSGSTGQPKGVAVTHRNLVNYVWGVKARLGLDEGASFATVSTFAADLGNTVVFSSLLTGGTLHIISNDRASDADRLSEYFDANPVDCLKIVPSHLNALLSGSNPAAVIPRKRLVLGGEASSWELIDRINSLAPDCRILNHYGPTETTVGVLTYEIEPGKRPYSARAIPLGRPLANTQAYILDCALQPVGIGICGELCIGGDGVARGYLGREELTSDKFVDLADGLLDSRLRGNDESIQNPKSKIQNRGYRTGDLARYLPDGNIEFLGRVDQQVKIRGYRIEPGEIEQAIVKLDSVREAVVIAREDTPGDKRLVAYVVAHGRPADLSASIKNSLSGQLPDYMVPAAVVAIDSIPLNANGKLDRHALPSPEEAQTAVVAVIPPRNAVEETLAGIWQEVLGIQAFGVHDNFFELGGHSLKATQVIARVRSTLKAELPLRSLFASPTVAGLAAALIADESKRAAIEATAAAVVELSRMSDEELEALLRERQSAPA